MTVTKHYRQAWVDVVYANAVTLFHNARKADTDGTPLATLARQAANTAFSDYADAIVGDKEALARRFMKHCRENFGEEIAKALNEQISLDIQQTDEAERQARVM